MIDENWNSSNGRTETRRDGPCGNYATNIMRAKEHPRARGFARARKTRVDWMIGNDHENLQERIPSSLTGNTSVHQITQFAGIWLFETNDSVQMFRFSKCNEQLLLFTTPFLGRSSKARKTQPSVEENGAIPRPTSNAVEVSEKTGECTAEIFQRRLFCIELGSPPVKAQERGDLRFEVRNGYDELFSHGSRKSPCKNDVG